MKFIFSDKANKGGVYKVSNMENGRVYIGSTSKFKSRGTGHRNDLEMNRHTNTFLQNDYNKCGADVFVFEVVEVVDGGKEERLKREQFFIDQFYDGQKNCYNLRKDAQDGRGGTRNVNPADRENDGRCRPLNETHKQKISDANKEAWQDESLRNQASIDANKRWQDTEHPKYQLTKLETMETVTVTSSLRGWCLERGLNYKAIHLLVSGKIKTSQGYFLGTEKPVYVDRTGEKRKPLTLEQRTIRSSGKFEGMKLVNDNGEMLTVERNVKEQCKRLNLHYTTFLKVLNGKCGSVGKWKLCM